MTILVFYLLINFTVRQMMKFNVPLIIFCFFSLNPYKVYGEDNYPIDINIYYNLTAVVADAEGNSSYTGNLINAVRQTLSRANINATFIASPWSRTLRHATKEHNSLIFQMIRNEEREDNFHWITPLSIKGEKFHLFTRNDPKLLSLTKEEVLAGPYTSTCRAQSAQCIMLAKFGFPEDRILKITDSNLGNLEELILRKRSDFLVGTKQREIENLTLQGIQDTFLVHTFEISSTMDYLTAPKSIDSELLEQIKYALRDFTLPKV